MTKKVIIVIIIIIIMPGSDAPMYDLQVSDDEEDPVQFNRFESEEKQKNEAAYRQQQRLDKMEQTRKWAEEGGQREGDEEEEEEEVVVMDMANPPATRNDLLPFPGRFPTSFRAPRLPRHKALGATRSPKDMPKRICQVPPFHHNKG